MVVLSEKPKDDKFLTSNLKAGNDICKQSFVSLQKYRVSLFLPQICVLRTRYILSMFFGESFNIIEEIKEIY